MVYIPPEEVYEFLVDFPRYARYSKHLTGVRQYGDGGPGTEYDLVFEWWKISYTARSRVESVDPPDRLNWLVVKDIDAAGYWSVEEVPDEAPPDRETAWSRSDSVTGRTRTRPGIYLLFLAYLQPGRGCVSIPGSQR